MLIDVIFPFMFVAMIFIAATTCVAKVIYMATQPGMIFGGWQHVLNRLNDSNSRLANALFKPLGGCELCFAHAFGVISFGLFLAFYLRATDSWPPNLLGPLWVDIVTNIVGYLAYVCTSTVFSTYAITRM